MSLDFAQAGLAGQSVTVECFVKPDARPAAMRGWRASRATARPARSCPSSGMNCGSTIKRGMERITLSPGERPVRCAAGHYLSSTRLTGDATPWRHVAVVYDKDAGSVTCWVDYHLAQSVKAEKPPEWDSGPFLIGGRADGWGVAGKLDEVRVARGALGPAQFLRARSDAISGVSFVSNQQIVPRDAGCLDVKENFGAAGDGQTDDTAALNAAFDHLASKVPLAYNTLIIPPGTYLVSGMFYCSRFIDVKGAGPDQTIHPPERRHVHGSRPAAARAPHEQHARRPGLESRRRTAAASRCTWKA